jgi:hypothetical protein
MDIGITVVGDTTVLETYMKSIPKRLQAACTDQAKRLCEDIRLRAPKDTTALSESAYYVAANGPNNYNERSRRAAELNPRIDNRFGGPLGSVEKPEGIATVVAMAAPYAAIVNGITDPFWTETVQLAGTEFGQTVTEFLTGNFLSDQGPEAIE